MDKDKVIIFIVFFPFHCHCAINALFNKTEAQSNCVRIHLVVFLLLHKVSMFQISRKSYHISVSRETMTNIQQCLSGSWDAACGT